MSSGLPVLADADTGFGEGEMTAKTVWEYFTAGAAGFKKMKKIHEIYTILDIKTLFIVFFFKDFLKL